MMISNMAGTAVNGAHDAELTQSSSVTSDKHRKGILSKSVVWPKSHASSPLALA